VTSLFGLLRDRRVLILLASTTLFQLSSSSALPFIALRVKDLGGSDAEVAALIVVSQVTIAPVAVIAGNVLDRLGRKPVFIIGFLAEPLRVLGCALVPQVEALIILQILGGVSAGIFGVAIVAMTADIARGTGHFHGLTGASRTGFALAAVVGPTATGYFVDSAGFGWAFAALAAIAAAGAALFILAMPETRPADLVTTTRPGEVLVAGTK
jgi:MFS family permease